MKWRLEADKFIIIMEEGDEVVSSLQAFSHENSIQGAFFFGLGAVKSSTVGYLDAFTGQYQKRTVLAQREITSLVGNISLVEGKPFAHCHIQLSDAEMNVKGGHLFEAHVSPTCEIMLFPAEGKLERMIIPGKEFKLITL